MLFLNRLTSNITELETRLQELTTECEDLEKSIHRGEYERSKLRTDIEILESKLSQQVTEFTERKSPSSVTWDDTNITDHFRNENKNLKQRALHCEKALRLEQRRNTELEVQIASISKYNSYLNSGLSLCWDYL